MTWCANVARSVVKTEETHNGPESGRQKRLSNKMEGVQAVEPPAKVTKGQKPDLPSSTELRELQNDAEILGLIMAYIVWYTSDGQQEAVPNEKEIDALVFVAMKHSGMPAYIQHIKRDVRWPGGLGGCSQLLSLISFINFHLQHKVG